MKKKTTQLHYFSGVVSRVSIHNLDSNGPFQMAKWAGTRTYSARVTRKPVPVKIRQIQEKKHFHLTRAPWPVLRQALFIQKIMFVAPSTEMASPLKYLQGVY